MYIDQLFSPNPVTEAVRTDLAKSRVMINEALLLEQPGYREWRQIGQQLCELDLSKQQILSLFGNVEQTMTNRDTGANRTMLGRGKDITTKYAGKIADMTSKILSSVQDSVPVEAVDTYYNQATNALNKLVGGDKGKVMKAIMAYRNLAKAYPKTAGFAKAALVAIAGMATGGAGLPLIAGLTYGLDSAIKGDRLSTVLGKGAGAAALAYAGQKVAGMFGNQPGEAGFTAEQPPTPAPGEVAPELAMGAGQPAPIPAPGEVAPELAMGAGQPAPIPAPEYDMGAGQTLPGAEGAASAASEVTRYTVTAADVKGLGSIAEKYNITAQQLWDANPQIADPNKIYVGQELNVPASTGEKVNVWDGWQGPTKKTVTVEPTANTEIPAPPAAGGAEAGPGAADTAGRGAAIDYSQPGPVTTDSLGQKLEYGIPVNDKGAFVPPNPNLPAEELARQQAAYDAWKSDYMKRWPNATQLPDGSMQGIKPGLAPMYPNMSSSNLPAGITPKALSGITADQIAQSQVYQQVYAQELAKYGAEPSARAIQTAQQVATLKAKAAMAGGLKESVKLRRLPVDKLIDQKLTTLSWALNESVGKPQGSSVHLTPQGVATVFENVHRVGEAIVKELRGVPGSMPGYLSPDLPGGPGKPVRPGAIGRGLNWLDKKAGQLGGFIKRTGHELTTNVTKDKLQMKWQTAGEPTDSDAVAALLIKSKVPADVVKQVFDQMGIPYTPKEIPNAKDLKAAQGIPNVVNPDTGKFYTKSELIKLGIIPAATTAKATAPAGAQEPAAQPAAQPAAKPNYGGGQQTVTPTLKQPAAAQPAAPAAAPAAATAPAAPTAKATAPAAGTLPGFDYKSVMQMPGMQKPVAKKPDFSMPNAYGKTTYSIKPPVVSGAKKPAPAMAESQKFIKQTVNEVKRQLAKATTKEDITQIKNHIDRAFVRHGLVNESFQNLRDSMIRQVVTIGAQRRRQAAQR